MWLFTGLDRSTSSQAGHAPFPGAVMESKELIPLLRQDPISCCPPCCCRWEAAVLGWLWFRLLSLFVLSGRCLGQSLQTLPGLVASSLLR